MVPGTPGRGRVSRGRGRAGGRRGRARGCPSTTGRDCGGAENTRPWDHCTEQDIINMLNQRRIQGGDKGALPTPRILWVVTIFSLNT